MNLNVTSDLESVGIATQGLCHLTFDGQNQLITVSQPAL